MNECLLCETPIAPTPSWKALLALEKQTDICQDCSKKFQRADIKEEDTFLDQITSLYTYNEAMREYLAPIQISTRRCISKRLRE